MDIPTPSPTGKRPGRVLLVVVDLVVRAIVKRVFGEDYEVDTTDRISDAVRAFSAKTYELVIADWSLADGCGVEVVRQCVGVNPRVSCILLVSDEESADIARSACSDHFLVLYKPLDIDQLRSWVRLSVISSGFFRTLRQGSKRMRRTPQ